MILNLILLAIGLGLFFAALKLLKISAELPTWRLVTGLVVLSLSDYAIAPIYAAAKAWVLATVAVVTA
jgi:hypothetical protein